MATKKRSRGGAKKKHKGPYVKKGNARYDRHDAYFRKAREAGYVARSVFKLEEIDRQFRIVHKTSRVLDLGCAPGSWLQYTAARTDPARGGCVVGIDLLDVQRSFGGHVTIHRGDAFDVDLDVLDPGGLGFSLVLSDMAPNTTGIKAVDQARSMALAERAFDLATRALSPGGHFCVKVLEGGEMQGFVATCRRAFDSVKIKRPKSTREGSMETFVIGLGFRAPS